MEIRFVEVDRATIPLILLLFVLRALGYMLARRWRSTVWFIHAGVAAAAIVLARELKAVFCLDLHPTLRRRCGICGRRRS